MKRILLIIRYQWLTLSLLILSTLPAPAQTWIQWRSADGGNNHYYALTPTATNWTAAEKLAVSWGGTLATITSSNEQNFINTRFLTGPFEHLPVWIGLADPGANTRLRRLAAALGLEKKVCLRWVTGEPLDYTNWKSGEPSNNPPGENYVAINWEFSDDPPRGIKGDWNDTPLNGTTGYGGKSDGPYFGLVERETDPTQPIPWHLNKTAFHLTLLIAVAVILLIYFTRSRRQKAKTAS